jgi:YEATS domain-containing protein 4
MDTEREKPKPQEPQEPQEKEQRSNVPTQPPDQPRMKDISITRVIVYGSEAHWLAKKSNASGRTHQWRVYVRGADLKEDISYFVKKVVFFLHPTFPNPKRVVEKPPFEITETGWGEFDILIVLYFTDPTEKPVELVHPLKLFARDGQPNQKNKPIISENYEEIVFYEPTVQFYNVLKEHPQATPQFRTHTSETLTLEEQQELERLRYAQQKVKYEISQLITKYTEAARQVAQLRREIHKFQSRNKANSNLTPDTN